MPNRLTRTKPSTAKDYEARLLRVLEHIDANLDDDLGLESLAAIAHFSQFHFHRIFKGMTGETLGSYIRRRRLERAANHLLTRKVSITELALDARFENSESFSRAFKTLFGLTPSQYRHSGKPFMTRQALKNARLGLLNSQAHALSRYMETEGRKTMFDVEIKKFPAIRQAYIRHVGPYVEMGPTYEKLMAEAGSQGLFGPGTQVMSLYYDDPQTVEASALRADAGISVANTATVKKPLQIQSIEAGTYAVGVLKGPYEGLQAAYLWLYGQWLPQSGQEAADRPPLEVYLTDPSATKPEDNLTEIRIPLI